jgi:hypothetical protein
MVKKGLCDSEVCSDGCMHIPFASIAFILISSITHIGADEMRLLSKGSLTIFAFGIPDKESTPARFRELADAGFTHCWWGWYPTADAMQKALDAASESGIKIIGTYTGADKQPEAMAKRFAKHPAFAGYYIADEPNAKDFAALGALARRFQAADPRHLAYVNLLPSFAAPALGAANYQEYIDRFFAEYPAQVLSFDIYPGYGNHYDTTWYSNLALIAKSAKAHKVPFWAFVLPTGSGDFVPTLASMRLEAFTNLAFGAQGIQYFGYWDWTAWDPNTKYHHAPVSLDGKLQPEYELVKRVNRDIAGMAPIFMDSSLLAIGHTAAQTLAGVEPYTPLAPVIDLKTDARGALVALHANQKRHFLVIVNRSLTGPMALSLKFDVNKKIARVDKQSVLHALDTPSATLQVEPGDIAIYCWDAQ